MAVSANLNPEFAKLLVQLESAWTPADISIPIIQKVQVNGEDWNGSLLGIELQDNILNVRLKGRAVDPFANVRYTITAQSEEDGRLWARVEDYTTRDGGSGADSVIIFHCEQWSYTPAPAHAPIAWVGKLDNITELKIPGNVLTRRQDGQHVSNSITHLRLAHTELATYFINQEKRYGTSQVAIVFENLTDGPITAERLAIELPLLRLVLSVPMRCDIAYGIDGQGQTTAAIAFRQEDAARSVNSNSLSPVPTTYVQAQGRFAWYAPFYRRLYNFYSANDGLNPVSYSIARYSHSLLPLDIDTQFELVAGAVWILLKEFLRQQVRDDPDYLNLLTTQRNSYQPTTPLDDINSIAAYWEEVRLLPELSWLRMFYGDAGVVIARELLAATKQLENGSLADYGEDLPPRVFVRQRYNRVQRLRRAYAVLLSRAIGYAGTLNLFPPSPGAIPDRTSWLPDEASGREDELEAKQLYQASADVTGLSVWPTFELPTLPKDELTKLFATFAEQVRYNTQGKVSARLRRLPRRHDEPVRFSFRLMVTQAPHTQVSLFTLEALKKGFEVQGWAAKPLRITSSAKLADFQGKLLASEEFKFQMERLLLIEEDIRRGEA